MENTLNERTLTATNFLIVLYFLMVYLVYFFKIDQVVIGVLMELVTIPFLLAQLAFLFIGGKRLLAKEKSSPTFVWSFSFLTLCAIITIGSFFL